MNGSEQWAKRALQHARVLSKGIGPRGATSDEEQESAEYVRDELQGLGLSDVWLVPFQGAISGWLPWAVAFSLAAWGMLIGLLFGLVGGIIAMAIYLLAAWTAHTELYPAARLGQSLWARGYPVRRWLGHRESQNVVAVAPPRGDVERRVVLMAYLDSARAPFLWQSQRSRRLAGCAVPLLFASLLLSAAVFLLAAFTANVLFYFVALCLLFPQIAGLIVSIRADRSAYSPGANNNASGVGTLLALAEQLKQSPLQHTEVWLLATACRETGFDGLQAFLDAHGSELAGGTFIALEGVGVGERVVYLTGEGALWTTSYSPDALGCAARSAERCQSEGLLVNAEGHRGDPTEMGVITRLGWRGTSISAKSNGRPGIPGRRQLEDTFDTIERQALSQVIDFCWALLQEIDA
jgi:hypothetical protein